MRSCNIIGPRARQICATYSAFAAVTAAEIGATVVTWGDPDWGGDSAVAQELQDVVQVQTGWSQLVCAQDYLDSIRIDAE